MFTIMTYGMYMYIVWDYDNITGWLGDTEYGNEVWAG